MELMLRYLQAAGGREEASEVEVSADAATAGSSPKATLQLIGRDIRPVHARFFLRGGRLCVQGVGGTVRIDGKDLRKADVAVGSEIEVGRHRLRGIAAPQGFDGALEVRRDPSVEPAEFEAAFRTDLAQTFLSRRWSAWLALAATLLIGFALPLNGALISQAGKAPPAWAPSDRLWLPGPLIHAHQIATREACASCHRVPFAHVADADCKTCHKRVQDHAQAPRLHAAGLQPTQRCAVCHAEHFDDPKHFVPRNESLCTDCHGRQMRFDDRPPVQAVRGFAKDEHPQFQVTLLRPDASALQTTGTYKWNMQTVALASAVDAPARVPDDPCRTDEVSKPLPNDPGPRLTSNLTFSHACHLNAQKVTRAGSGDGLGCADCHALSVDGSHFVPLTMNHSCESAGCHSLEFAREGGFSRELPHGKPEQAVTIIQDFYIKRAAAPPGTTAPPRHLPNRVEPPPCAGPPYACGISQARFEIELAFLSKDGMCRLCHAVTDLGSTALAERFRVAPVRLQWAFFKTSDFDHRTHEVQGKLTGDRACESCHAARKSMQSSDLMIPTIEKCLECHSKRPEKNKVALSCGSCHVYHPRGLIAPPSEGST
jgi:hypothetical protein